MKETELLALILVTSILGIVVGALAFWIWMRTKLGGFQKIGAEILKRSECDAETLRKAHELTLKQQQVDQQRELENLWHAERRKLQREDERLQQREDKLEERMNLVEKKLTDIEKREAVINARTAHIDEEQIALQNNHTKLLSELERLSGLSVNEAKEFLFSKMLNDAQTDANNTARRIRKVAEEEAEREAARIISTAICRLAVACVSESTVNTVSLPSEEMKGRIIGREGRNIRALEQATGINFSIDDTPGVVVLSGFDPIRLHVAKLALTDLLKDGRIHPTRIEEAVEKARSSMQKLIKQAGEDAALRTGTINLHPELIQLLGRLKFRYSYGQNVLDHSVEVSHLMGLMAGELGLNADLAKRIGLLHDVGKAVSHEVEGTHALIGRDLALKYGETPEVANGIGCHHFEIEATTIEGSLCSAADAMSASRQGARSEPVEEYIKRLQRLEEMALEFSGVDRAYALQAGREVRVMVLPDQVDDAGTDALARELTKRIEDELRYPGKIKVTVVREKRAVVYAV